MSLGMTEVLLILGIALLFFGPSKLPGLGRAVGEAIRGFKKGVSGEEVDVTPPQARRDEIPGTPSANAEQSKTESKEKTPVS